MKKTLAFFLVLTLIFLAVGCNDTNNKNSENTKANIINSGTDLFNENGTKNLSLYDSDYQNMGEYEFSIAGSYSPIFW